MAASVAAALGTDDRHYAYRALRAHLHVLRDRLAVEQAAQLAAQLPNLLRGIYYEGWNPSSTPMSIHHERDFVARIAAEGQFAGTTEAGAAIRRRRRAATAHLRRRAARRDRGASGRAGQCRQDRRHTAGLIVVNPDDLRRGEDALALSGLLAALLDARLLAVCVEPPGAHTSWRRACRGAPSRCSGDAGKPRRCAPRRRSHGGDRDRGGIGAARARGARAERGAQLVAVGSSRRGRLERVVAGSVPERLVHEGRATVAVATRTGR